MSLQALYKWITTDSFHFELLLLMGPLSLPRMNGLSKIGGMIIRIALGTLRSQYYRVGHKPHMDCPGSESNVTKRLSSGADQPSVVRLDVTAAVQA